MSAEQRVILNMLQQSVTNSSRYCLGSETPKVKMGPRPTGILRVLKKAGVRAC